MVAKWWWNSALSGDGQPEEQWEEAEESLGKWHVIADTDVAVVVLMLCHTHCFQFAWISHVNNANTLSVSPSFRQAGRHTVNTFNQDELQQLNPDSVFAMKSFYTPPLPTLANTSLIVLWEHAALLHMGTYTHTNSHLRMAFIQSLFYWMVPVLHFHWDIYVFIHDRVCSNGGLYTVNI